MNKHIIHFQSSKGDSGGISNYISLLFNSAFNDDGSYKSLINADSQFIDIGNTEYEKAFIDIIKVDVYGQQMPINQIGSITTPEPRMINIQVWDLNNVPLIDAAIKEFNTFVKTYTYHH